MSLYLDQKYINQLSNRVRNFKRKGQYHFSLSCPICGDSDKDTKKARGNFYVDDGRMKYNCFNEGCSFSSVGKFLQVFDNSLYEEYRVESLFDKNEEQKFIKDKKIIEHKTNPLSVLMKVSELADTHFCKEYIISRKIPEKYIDTLYFAPKFYQWINDYVEPNKFSETSLKFDKPRMIIPLINKDGTMHGLQGRTFDISDPAKYITIITDERYPKIYGLDRVNFHKTVYVLEGCFDSLFINNAIAMCGGDLTTCLAGFQKKNVVLIFDNEPRNKTTVKKIGKAINDGYSVVIFPDKINQKDINKMILDGYSQEKIMELIENNTYTGMMAKLRWSDWRI